MCTDCPFSIKTNKRQIEALLKNIDNVISFKGKKIKEIGLSVEQFNMLWRALPLKDIELHTPMHRSGVLLKRLD